MATPYTTSCGIALTSIDGVDCIGDSRKYINNNIQNLGNAICSISGFNVQDSNTIDLTWQNSTRTLSADVKPGTIINILQATNNNLVVLSNVIDVTTAPTSASGTQILSAAITPQSNSSKVLISFNAWGGTGTSTSVFPTAVILRNSTVIQTIGYYEFQNAARALFTGLFLDEPNTTNNITYSIRLGVRDSGHNIYLNGKPSGIEYAGTSYATLILQEVKG